MYRQALEIRPGSAPGVSQALLSATQQWVAFAILFDIVLAGVEGALRYGLHKVGLDSAIFFRDALLFGSFGAYLFVRIPLGAVPASVGVFALLMLVHGAIAVAQLHTGISVVYGLKLMLPILCGFLVPDAIFAPSRRVTRWMLILWIVSVAGAAYDRIVLGPTGFFPWVGTNVSLGGIDVELGRDWQSGDEIKRVGGLARSSINLATLLPLVAVMVFAGIRNIAVRVIVAALTVMVLYWTTQKGALLAYPLAMLSFALVRRQNAAVLRVCVVAMALLCVLAPTVLIQFRMPHDEGVFSFESFIARIESMWPEAWVWINDHSMVFGVGLGGIGGAQRFYAPLDFNAADNLFVYFYANFGIMTFVYMGAAVAVALVAPVRDPSRDALALASLAFLLGYGVVISLVEDHIASFWLGATLAWLVRAWQADRSTLARRLAPDDRLRPLPRT